ncbi:MAG: metalloregulator ArsR/SmtB family transcription factor [Blastocatellia bacterium]|nr:metalloregulator ArsR/SmtB family transcription factor [Blastocatellia bacterium]
MNEAKTKSTRPELLFQALADRTRLRILNLMGNAEVCVCFFVVIIGPNQPKISRHLAYLRKAGVVSCRRDGKWAHYRLVIPADPQMAKVLQDTLEWIASDPEMQRDRAYLTEFCCAPQVPLLLRGAPLPVPIPALVKLGAKLPASN